MSKELLREWIALDYNKDTLRESRESNPNGKLILSGIIQKSDTENQNERIYPHAILQREIENYQKVVRENRAVGELDHPETSTVSLERASHIVREMWWEGKDVFGKIEILSSPMGKILEGHLMDGVRFGISSRGVGSTEKGHTGISVVQPDYQIICFDIVSEPSTPGAYLFSEGRDYTKSPVKFTKADKIFRALNDIVLR